MTELERLRDYVLARCSCPCCTQTKICTPECTYEHDCPKEWDDMMEARRSMYVDLPLDSERGK